jgi:Uma2 family endonuclease
VRGGVVAFDRSRRPRGKLQVFARYGVPEYWIADADAEVIEVHRLEAGGHVLTKRASGDDEVRSAVVGGTPIRARQIFPSVSTASRPSSRRLRTGPSAS